MHRKPICTVAAVVLLTFTLSSCASMQQTYQENPKAMLGGLLGAGAGAGIAALAGGSPAAIVGAAVGGALIGGFVGHKMDNNDKQKAAQAAQQAFEQNQAGQPTVWNNPQTGNSGSITPTRTYQLANGQYCRQYQQTITIGGEQHQSYGTACRQPDGNWQIQPS
ncbi:MAG TPA: RT0821/Lpp0805 family surface protein [Candidatus Margulisiibacteriota bacterium]|nr:RT0821/Lpp0805 family surface protein [Candidatus Margulisiibacteriota bacterium]